MTLWTVDVLHACGRPHKDTHHTLQCTSNDQQEVRDKETCKFDAMLSKYHTPRPMVKLIIKAMKQWSAGCQVCHHMYTPQDFDDKLNQEFYS